MKQEEIEKAAVDSCVFERGIFNPELTPYYDRGFKDGANWRINSVWHRHEEEAENGSLIFIKSRQGNVFMVRFYDEWHEMVRKYVIKQWAYMKDLLPNMEE